MNKQIFWIASFPKSGNTLIRSLLASLFFTDDGIFDLNLLQNIPYIEDTSNLEFIKKINPEDYKNLHSPKILSNYWEKMQSKQNLNLKEDFIFMKTHHALVKIFNNDFTNKENTRGVIYVVRDPRDIVVSLKNFSGKSLDKIINDSNKKIFLVSIPRLQDYYENKNINNVYWHNYYKLKDENTSNFKFINLIEYPPKNLENIYLKCDGHWSPDGNKWAAEIISEKLMLD